MTMIGASRVGFGFVAIPVSDHLDAAQELLRSLRVTWADALEHAPTLEHAYKAAPQRSRSFSFLPNFDHLPRRRHERFWSHADPLDSASACWLRIGPADEPPPNNTDTFCVEFTEPRSEPRTAYVAVNDLLIALHKTKALHELLRSRGRQDLLEEAERVWDRMHVAPQPVADRFVERREIGTFELHGVDPEGDDLELSQIEEQRSALLARLTNMAPGKERDALEREIQALESVAHVIALRAT